MGADECLINSAKSFALIFNYHERGNMVSKQGINYIDHVFIFITRSPATGERSSPLQSKIENMGLIIFNNHIVGKENEKLGLITCCKGFKVLEMADKMRFELMVPKYVIFQVWCIKPLCHMSYV